MLADLYDNISLMFSRRWPTTEASITAVDLSYGRGIRVVVVYEFSLDDDGPYTGQSPSPWWFGGTDVTYINNKLQVGQTVTVRYRRDRPSVNKIDRSVWSDLQDGL